MSTYYVYRRTNTKYVSQKVISVTPRNTVAPVIDTSLLPEFTVDNGLLTADSNGITVDYANYINNIITVDNSVYTTDLVTITADWS